MMEKSIGPVPFPDFPPPATQPMWVPFPGSKRKAEEPLSDQLRASPVKVCIRGPSANNSPLSVNAPKGSGSGGIETNRLTLAPSSSPSGADEEMDTPETAPGGIFSPQISLLGGYAGVHLNIEKRDVGDDLNPNEHEKFEKNVDENRLNNSPKLYFSEVLREVQSYRLNEDLILPRSLTTETQKSTSMAMVLWKKPHHILPSNQDQDQGTNYLESDQELPVQEKNPQDEDEEMEGIS